MTERADLDLLRTAWERVQDGETGYAYGEALESLGRLDEAIAVFNAVSSLGYAYGLYCLPGGRAQADDSKCARYLVTHA